MTYATIYPDEADIFSQFAMIGIIPGAEYPPKNMSPELIFAIQLGMGDGNNHINEIMHCPKGASYRNGWVVQITPPPFGNRTVMSHHYLTRAASARGGIYGLDPQEALYPKTCMDSAGNGLNGGTNSYRMTFTPDSMPKTSGNGFWSITLYNSTGRFYDNPINRYSIGDHTENLYYQRGNLTLCIQHDKPQDPRAFHNWLPAPSETFYMIARIYWPTQDELDNPYLPPGLEPIEPWEWWDFCFSS